jgi:hypothetical protein
MQPIGHAALFMKGDQERTAVAAYLEKPEAKDEATRLRNGILLLLYVPVLDEQALILFP